MPEKSPTPSHLSRRSFLNAAVGGALASLWPPLARADPGYAIQTQQPSSIPAPPNGALRIAHLTDWHLMDRRHARAGLEAALAHTLAQKPGLILNGGDTMTHTMARPLDDARADMRVIEQLFRQQSDVPMIHAPGNHDIWGWTRAKSGATGREAEYGKRWWIDRIGQGQRYRAQTVGGWRFISLDSIRPRAEGYITGLDDPQFDWLARELADTPADTPVLILTHAPILGVGTLLSDGHIDPDEGYRLGPGHIYRDAHRIVELCRQHPNVRLALSGHKHIHDRIEFQGLTHICGGAVCGNWWRPTRNQRRWTGEGDRRMPRPYFADPGYGLLDLLPDGRFEYQYVRFPWTFAA